MLTTTGMAAEPEDSDLVPQATAVPFVAASGIALLFVGVLVQAALVGWVGVAIGIIGVAWWTWHTEEELP